MITQGRLKELVDYNKDTGLMTWRERKGGQRFNTKHAGKEVGTNIHGYMRAPFDGVFHPVSRMAWLYVYGAHPKHEVDHINGNTLDNRICNLRDVSHTINSRNQKIDRRNTSGVMGVRLRGRSWTAYITINRKRVNLGSFPTKEEAVKARVASEVKHRFHENHGRN